MTIDKISIQNEAGKTLVRVTDDYRVLVATTLSAGDSRYALIQLAQGLANLHGGVVDLLERLMGDRGAHPECFCAGCDAARFLEILKNPKLH